MIVALPSYMYPPIWTFKIVKNFLTSNAGAYDIRLAETLASLGLNLFGEAET